MVVACAIFAALVTIAVPLLSRTPSRVVTATRQLAEDIEQMRLDAVAESGHYLFRVGSNTTYAIHRMRRSLGRWQAEDAPVRTGVLPAGVAFARDDDAHGAEVELDARGFLTPADGAPVLALRDDESGERREVSVLPNGRVAML